MKFLCLDCDEPMKLLKSDGPDEGSLTVTFRCPECGFRVAMLTNPFETQMIKSLGVKVGGRTEPAQPFEHLRASMARSVGLGAPAGATPRGELPATESHDQPGTSDGPGCPFAAMVSSQEAHLATVPWTPEAEARVDRIPSFIRPMAKKAIERFAEGKGYASITEDVMDEARGALGM